MLLGVAPQEERPAHSEVLREFPIPQRSYKCRCGRPVFFRNSQCLNCHSELGYEPRLGAVVALEPARLPGVWIIGNVDLAYRSEELYRRCANLNTPAACNWLVNSEEASRQPYCSACRLNRTIPNLSLPGNAELWGRIENAKRYVVSSLITLGLPVASRVSEAPQTGLAFDFLQSLDNGGRVLTGHENGVITLNVEEADDLKREQVRASMREPYRTLIGHFRHEVGHYYWERLVAHSTWLPQFRSLFGDERGSYEAALQRNYSSGPKADWINQHVSAYASVHPWEDWAETWAHYLHMIDALGTALSFGIRPDSMSMPFDCYGSEVLFSQADDHASARFLSLLNSWLKLNAVMNELCRSMGQPDFYPFTLSRAAVTKLHFVHLVVTGGTSRLTTPRQMAARAS